MNAPLQAFGFGEKLVRVVQIDGAAWFVAKDVCAVLAYTNDSQAIAKLDDDEKSGVCLTDPHGRDQQTNIISESGVYALIFRSRKTEAVQFRKWVTGDVLPQLRQHGHYALPRLAEDETEDALPSGAEELERLKIGIQLVREARNVFGRDGAKRAWLHMGLPDLDLAPGRIDASDGERWGSVTRWLADRVEVSPGHETASKLLHDDYITHARAAGETVIHNQTNFGLFLRQAGYKGVKRGGGIIHRTGLRLKPARGLALAL